MHDEYEQPPQREVATCDACNRQEDITGNPDETLFLRRTKEGAVICEYCVRDFYNAVASYRRKFPNSPVQ